MKSIRLALLLIVSLLLVGSQVSVCARDRTAGAGERAAAATSSAATSLQVSAKSLDFGVQPLNSFGPAQTITITNVGTGPASLNVLLVQKTNGFLLTHNCPASLAVGDSCMAWIRAQPLEAGVSKGHLHIGSNAPEASLIVALSVSASEINDHGGRFLPDALAFPAQAAGTTGDARVAEFTMSSFAYNPSSEPDPVKSAVVGGPDVGDFVVRLKGCRPTVHGCSIVARFAPRAGTSGTRHATVTVASDAYGSPHVLTLTGSVAEGPVLDFDANSLDFGNVAPATAKAAVVKLGNPGSGSLIITAITASSPDFFPSPVGCGSLPITLAPHSACSIRVRFSPSRSGLASGSVDIASNASAGSASLVVSGIGADPAGPVLKLSANTASFSAMPTNESAEPKLIILHNAGQKRASLSIAQTNEFSTWNITGGGLNACGDHLEAGQRCRLDIGFAPLQAGLRRGDIAISSNAPGGVRSIALDGVGFDLPPQVQFSSTRVDLGLVGVGGNSRVQSVGVSDFGGPLKIASIHATAPFKAVSHCPAALATNDSCTIDVQALSVQAGPAAGLLVLQDQAGLRYGLMLSVVGGAGPVIEAHPASVDFGAVDDGSGRSKSVTISNTGSGPAPLTSIAVTGDSAFSKGGDNCPASLAAGAKCTVKIDFFPPGCCDGTNEVFVFGMLSIEGRFIGSPLEVPLEGGSPSGASLPAPSRDSALALHDARRTLRIAPGALEVSAGASVKAFVRLEHDAMAGKPVRFSCSGLPVGARCEFSPAELTPSGRVARTMLTIHTSGNARTALSGGDAGTPRRPDNAPAPLLFAAAGGLAFAVTRTRPARRSPADRTEPRRRTGCALRRWIGAVLLVSTAGCGGSADGPAATERSASSTAPAADTTTVTVTATIGSGHLALKVANQVILRVR